jgi:hypothetical protein
MFRACYVAWHMKMIQVRNVPDDLHRALKERAARDGTTMSHLILNALPRIANDPSAEQVLARIRARTSVGGQAGAELVRADRDAR